MNLTNMESELSYIAQGYLVTKLKHNLNSGIPFHSFSFIKAKLDGLEIILGLIVGA